jgi:hypothetical protein
VEDFYMRSNVLLALLFLVPFGAACAADNAGMPRIPDDPNPMADGARLEVIGSTSRIVNESSDELVEVRYLDANGLPIDGIVDFAIEGDGAGATLSGNAAPTDADGIARIHVRAGGSTDFDLVATAARAALPAVVSFRVQQMRFSNLEVTVTYGGRRDVQTVELALFTNVTCTTLNTSIPVPRDVKGTRVYGTETFEAVEVGIPLAVYALGIDRRDNVAAESCLDHVLTPGGDAVTIDLVDTRELFGGTYTTVETFDVTEGFDPTLAFVLDLLEGVATDPAAYVVDLVASSPDTPSFVRSALAIPGTRDAVVAALRDAIAAIHIPGYLLDLADFGYGVNLAFERLTLDGQLTFPEPDEFGAGVGSHRLTQVRFPLTDGSEASRMISVRADDIAINVGPEISIAEHALPLEFGALIEMVLNDVLLARVPGSPTSITDLLHDLLDCAGIAASLSGDPTIRSIATSACDIGLALLGATVEDSITDLWSYDTLHLSGTAALTDEDQDYDRDHLVDGHANSRWTGTSGELIFTGTLSGERLDDVTGREHPVRARLTGLH